MQTTKKYSSSGWRKNRLLPFALLTAAFAFAQDADHSVKQTLAARYPMAMLQAYQDNSLEKLNDFYHYLNLLSATSDKQLQAQLKESIFLLFEGRNVVVENFLTAPTDAIPLKYLLENIASRNITFALKNESVSKEFYRDYWLDTYELEISSKGATSIRKIRQRIYLKPSDKVFGDEHKTVLQISLGEIE